MCLYDYEIPATSTRGSDMSAWPTFLVGSTEPCAGCTSFSVGIEDFDLPGFLLLVLEDPLSHLKNRLFTEPRGSGGFQNRPAPL